MKPVVSERGQRMPSSPIRKLMPLADAARSRGVRVYPLNLGQPDLETPAAMRRHLAETPKVIAYSPSAGTPECLATLQEYYRRIGLDHGTDEIITTTGGSEAVLFAMMAGAGEGDDVLLVEPFYTNYQAFATMAGLRLVPLATRGEDGFHLPPREAWEKARTPRTRMVLLCNPNNPTGTVYTTDELRVVAEFCRDHGLFLVADEVYRELVFDGRKHVSALSLSGFETNVVVVDSLSKRYSACGIRLGSLVTRNRELYGACFRMAQGRLSPPGLAQLVATGASELGPDYWTGLVSEYQSRRDILYEGLCRIPGVLLRKPEGAFYFVPRLPIEDAEDFAAWLLTDFSVDGKTVLVSPAPGFYATAGLGRNEVRIAYVLKKEDLVEAVSVLAQGLAAYRKARGLGPVAAAAAVSAG
jgi:aspartate aminotransferase